MMYYKISHGSVTLGYNMVLEDINFCVKDNEKIGKIKIRSYGIIN